MIPEDPSEFTDLFAGLRVVEIGQYVAAPYCAELFANGGADVISIEPLTGSPTRFGPPGAPDGVQYLSKARGKRSISMALNTADGTRAARDLALSADVVISNLRPGLAERLGLDFETLSIEKPTIIVAHVDGFGDLGGERGCVDIVAQAASGLLASLALSARPDVRRDVLLTDVAAGMLLAFGVSSALWFRERTGRGQRVATSLMAAGLALQVRTAHVVGDGQPALIRVIDDLAEGAQFSDTLARRNALTNKMYPTYDVFETANGWVSVGAVRGNAHLLLAAAGLDPRSDLTDPALSDQLRRSLASKDADDLIAELERGGVPVARVRLVEEVLLDDQQVEAGIVAEMHHDRLGRLRFPAAPVRFSGARYETSENVPDLGADTVAVLEEVGWSSADIDDLVSSGVLNCKQEGTTA
ncbi:CaiB/BaiF CoA transferase family protein [Ilumatobacter sp.]|uniref:CaiB/BaiF CoA transferase family protein n=1 Tax=Ilumatobacter sp. TaxID=1967498 RepID=UPI0037538990